MSYNSPIFREAHTVAWALKREERAWHAHTAAASRPQLRASPCRIFCVYGLWACQFITPHRLLGPATASPAENIHNEKPPGVFGNSRRPPLVGGDMVLFCQEAGMGFTAKPDGPAALAMCHAAHSACIQPVGCAANQHLRMGCAHSVIRFCFCPGATNSGLNNAIRVSGNRRLSAWIRFRGYPVGVGRSTWAFSSACMLTVKGLV